jgi:hypothetical protein
MPYGGVKIDNITFTNAGVDANVTVSGLYAGITSGITVTGTVSGNTIQGQTISGVTVTGTTSNFASGVFTTQLSGATITGTTGNFTSLTAVTGTFTTRLSGATITGNTGQFTNITGVAIGATTVTGTTVTGTTANFVTGVFTTQLSGVTVTGTTASFTSGVFTTLTGGTINTASFNAASLAIGSGSVTAPSFSFSGDSNTGLYTPSGDVFGITTSGTGKLTVDNTTAPVKEVYSGTFYPIATQVDVGTDANQIPLNQYLGSMAFQDSVSVSVGRLLANGLSGIGYTIGAGSAVTQATSRTTGVTINAPTGSITLVSAAGSIVFQTFTVTNSAVAATDVIVISQKSGTDKYAIWITTVAAGSFNITFATLSGTTTEQPVFNFAVIKAVNS